MQVEGKIKVIDETKDVGTTGFQKRDCVIVTDSQYPQTILVQFVQDKCNLLNSFNIGDNVKIDINLKGREWVNPQGETKYFNTIEGWKITKAEVFAPTNTQQPSTQTQPIQATPMSEDKHDDLPF